MRNIREMLNLPKLAWTVLDGFVHFMLYLFGLMITLKVSTVIMGTATMTNIAALFILFVGFLVYYVISTLYTKVTTNGS